MNHGVVRLFTKASLDRSTLEMIIFPFKKIRMIGLKMIPSVQHSPVLNWETNMESTLNMSAIIGSKDQKNNLL